MDITPYLELVPAPRVFLDRAARSGEQVRYRVRRQGAWAAVSWAEQADVQRAVAGLCIAEGLEAGDRVALLAPNRVEWMAAALGVQTAGGVMVPIYPSSTPAQIAHVAVHSDARLLFVDTVELLSRVLERWDDLGAVCRIVLFDDAVDLDEARSALEARGAKAPPIAEVERKVIGWSKALARGREVDDATVDARLDAVTLEDGAIMLYTSGTSGQPKGVPLTHRNLTCNQEGWLRACGALLDDDAVDLHWLPMSHIFGYGEACLGNLLGWTTWLTTPDVVLDTMTEVRPHIFMSVPSYWEKLAAGTVDADDLRTRTGGRLRFCLSGGAGLKVAVKERFLEAGCLVLEGYGLTECAPTLTLNQPQAYRFDTVGKPLSNVELKLASDGEILAKGPNIFAGYHKDVAATAEAFSDDGWFKTGDIGRWTDDGFLRIVDRKKDILVTAGGKNVPPTNIEVRFRDDPLIEHVVVYGDGHRYLVAGVWLSGPVERAAVAERIEAVNGELARHETIKRFAIMDPPLTVDEGFLTPTLKIRRKRIYEHFRRVFEGLYDS